MKLRKPKHPLRAGATAAGRIQQPLGPRRELESAVEAEAEGAQVSLAVLFEVQGVKGTTEAGLEVAQHRVNPAEFWEIFRVAATGDDGRMLASSLNH